jgi:hypothetical protein
MLSSPLLVGMLAGGLTRAHLPLTLFWFAGYFAFFATSQWLKSGRRARWWPPVRFHVLLTVALGSVTALIEPALLRWAPLFVVPLAVGLYAAAHRHERDLLAGLTTVVGSALMTVVAYDAGTAASLQRGWLLGLVQLLYFAGTVFYVKSVIRERGSRRHLALSVGFHVAAAAALTPVSPWLGVVFALLTLRALAVPGLHPTPRQAGLGEVLATVVVAVVSLVVI